MDPRASAQCRARVRQGLDEEKIFQLTGLNLDATHVAPKIRWLKDEQGAIYEQAAYFSCREADNGICPDGRIGRGFIQCFVHASAGCVHKDLVCWRWPEVFGIDLNRMVLSGGATAPLGKFRADMADSLGLSRNCCHDWLWR